MNISPSRICFGRGFCSPWTCMAQPLADRHGAPLRVIDPARYGYKSAKLVTSIEFVESRQG